MEIRHYPVMHRQVLEMLQIPSGRSTMIDCTTGEGGHTSLFLEKYPELSVIGLDRDKEIQKKAIERLAPYGERFTPVLTWFDEYLSLREESSVDAILFDLGISMFHFEESGRGFSFRSDEKLDMRLDSDGPQSAADIVNRYREEDLANLIYRYGEERYSRRIASAIAERRKEKRFELSSDLADVIYHSVPGEYRHGRIHPATRTFQALRIEVNGELDRITPALSGAVRAVRPGGRIAVITFHSLEDRIVKWFFKDLEKEGPIRILTKKPIIPDQEEIVENPPSRSAKLRVVEKV